MDSKSALTSFASQASSPQSDGDSAAIIRTSKLNKLIHPNVNLPRRQMKKQLAKKLSKQRNPNQTYGVVHVQENGDGTLIAKTTAKNIPAAIPALLQQAKIEKGQLIKQPIPITKPGYYMVIIGD